MAVSTTVIVAILILGVCLVTTSAVLAYKLRPDKNNPLMRRKPSTQASDASSALRKMTLVNGMVTEDDPPRPPPRSFMARWSNMYASHRTSGLSSKYHSTAAIYSPSDLEAQINEEDEKFPQINIEERLSYEKTRRGRRSRRSSVPSPKTTTIQRDSDSADGEDSLEEIISPHSFPIPPSPGSFPGLPSPRPEGIPPRIEPRAEPIRRKPIATADQAALDRRHSTPSRSQTRAQQPEEVLDPDLLEAAAAFSVALPPDINKKSIPEPPSSPRPDPPSQSFPETRPSSEPLFISFDPDEIRTPRGRGTNLETIAEATTSPPRASEDESQVQPQRQRSRSRPRPPPKKPAITPIVGKRRPPPIRITPSNIKATPVAPKSQRPPHDTILTPDTEPDTEAATKTAGSITPPVMSSNITDVVPIYPFFVTPIGKSRQSIATMTSSQYSPNFALSTAQPMPFVTSRPRPRSGDLPAVQLDIPSPSNITQPAPVSKYRQPTTSFRTSSLPQATETTALSSHPPVTSATATAESEAETQSPTSVPLERTKRPSRYKHLMDEDKDLPQPRQSEAAVIVTRPDLSSSSSSSSLRQVQPQAQPRNRNMSRSPETLEFQAALRSSASIILTPRTPQPPPQSLVPLPLRPSPLRQQQQLMDPQQLLGRQTPRSRSLSLTTRPSHDETRESVLATYFLDAEDPEVDDNELQQQQRQQQEQQQRDEAEDEAQAAVQVKEKSATQAEAEDEGEREYGEPSGPVSPVTASERGKSRGSSRRRRGTPGAISPLTEEFPPELRFNLNSPTLKLEKLDLNLDLGLDLGEDFGKSFFS